MHLSGHSTAICANLCITVTSAIQVSIMNMAFTGTFTFAHFHPTAQQTAPTADVARAEGRLEQARLATSAKSETLCSLRFILTKLWFFSGPNCSRFCNKKKLSTKHGFIIAND